MEEGISKKKVKEKIQAQGGAAKKVMSLFKNAYVLFFLQFNLCYSKSYEALIILQWADGSRTAATSKMERLVIIVNSALW